ncbi:amp dependent CoA ligase [Aspergillus avenaceus]|uniref:Amp dependent CoA ligase n=1 Tax=Aspergillus avenaceus TaxID=36643 RepID=A0A5N6TL93_ASPAV|nr:amp dependent CoA ligase [Aspergillus avenaceus]
MNRAMSQVPQEPFFTELYQHWCKSPEAIIIRDLAIGKESTAGEFLYDVLIQRDRISQLINAKVQKQLDDPHSDNVFMAIFGTAGYEFAVLVFAIYSLGAVVVPLAPRLHPDEADYFLKTADISLVTATQGASEQAKTLSAGITTYIYTPEEQMPATHELELEPAGTTHSQDKGFVLLFTSGTTGPPKGALHSRRGAYIGARTYLDGLGLSPRDTFLHPMAAHWKGGFDFFIACICSGACIEFCASVYSSQWFWQRLQQGGVTCAITPTPVLHQLREALDAVRNTVSPSTFQQMLQGLRELRVMGTGSMKVPESVMAYWKELRGGQPLTNLYGATELVGMVSMTDWKSDKTLSANNCGMIMPHLTVKVSDEGELLVKGPQVMRRYISSDPRAMNGVFDPDGFFKTGDLGEVGPDGELFFFGRVSHDVIRYAGWKIHAPEIEDALQYHPEIARAVVVGVADPQIDQRVAALITRKDSARNSIESLAILRQWLAAYQNLPYFKLPTMLRIISGDDKVPVTDSGKPVKPKIRDTFFNPDEIASGRVEMWDLATKDKGMGDRPWDWEGMGAD